MSDSKMDRIIKKAADENVPFERPPGATEIDHSSELFAEIMAAIDPPLGYSKVVAFCYKAASPWRTDNLVNIYYQVEDSKSTICPEYAITAWRFEDGIATSA
jgi:hypothetical protein